MDTKVMYSRFKKASTPPRVLTMLAWLVALILACVNEGDSQDGTYIPSIVMISLTIVAPGLISLGLDWLFMLYALATLIVVSLPLGENTTLKNIWVPITYSISSIAGHWMKEKANVKENIDFDLEFFDGYAKWLSRSIWCGGGAFAFYIGAWINSNDTNLFWGIGLFCIALWSVLSIMDYTFREGDLKLRGYGALKEVLDSNFEQSNEWIIVKLSLAMASTVFVGAFWEKKRQESWLVWIALIGWIFAMFSIHRAKKYFEDYYVYKGN